MQKPHIFLFLFLISSHIFGQVNIEQYRNDTGSLEKKYHQHINITSSIKRSTVSLYSIGLKYFKPFYLTNAKGFFISKINYGESNGSEYLNDTFYHLRIISSKTIFKVIPEAFLQYENNEFSLTSQRYLAGIGVRYQYGETTNGTSIINEWYQESSGIGRLNNWRLSQYIKFRFKFNKTNKIDSTIYIQPSIIDFSNIRYYSENTYISQITDAISYNSSLTAKFFSKSSDYNKVELFFDSGLQFKI
tara:strand:+ start:3388 stop:4125 length:738 start_codon:yes stop_codon:yes gene_type:complete